MEGARGVHGWPDDDSGNPWHQLELSVQLLRLMQSDYQQARRHLEDICSAFGDREHMTRQYLHTAVALATPAGVPSVGPTTVLPFVLGVPCRPAPVIAAPQMRAATSLGPMQVRCLGRFEVRLGWTKVETWRSRKAKTLLKYLVAQGGRPIPKDVLMETLWPEAAPQAANNSLKAAVHALRQTLDLSGRDSTAGDAASYVLFVEGNYLLNPEVEVWIDVDEFERQWAEGRRLDREGQVSEATALYAAAERLYIGDFLEDDLYEDWTLLRREALKDTYLAVLSKLSDRAMRDDDCESCIVYCQKTLAKDPCREDAYRSLMQSHSRLGHRSRALNWYGICTKTLNLELDTAPDAETAALYQRLLKGEVI